jgi:hypothetical protein
MSSYLSRCLNSDLSQWVKAHLEIVTHQLKRGVPSRAVYFAQSFSSPW